MPAPAATHRTRSIFKTLLEVGAIWTVASGTYGIFLPSNGFLAPYAEHPFITAIYYASWVCIAAVWFRDVLVLAYTERTSWRSYLLTALLGGFLYWFYVLQLPSLPSAHLHPLIGSNVYLEPGDPSYLISKSVEILLQQTLIAVVVLTLATRLKSVMAISAWFAGCFWVIHLFLLAQGMKPDYVALYSTAAFCAAFIFPYLILRVPSGFVLSYALHWSFYVGLAIVTRL